MAEAETPSAPAGKSSNLMTFVFMGVNIAVLGLGAYLAFLGTLGVEQKKLTNADAERELSKFENTLHGEPVLYTMAPFNTNLDGLPRRLIRLKLSLEMMDEEGYEEIIGIVPQARDSIMRLLQGKNFTDVESVQGKLNLKNQIVAELNTSLKKGVVKNVYFNELVVQ